MYVHAPKHTEFILNVTQSYLKQSKTLTHVFLQEFLSDTLFIHHVKDRIFLVVSVH